VPRSRLAQEALEKRQVIGPQQAAESLQEHDRCHPPFEDRLGPQCADQLDELVVIHAAVLGRDVSHCGTDLPHRDAEKRQIALQVAPLGRRALGRANRLELPLETWDEVVDLHA
jgi:hypothetical protein